MNKKDVLIELVDLKKYFPLKRESLFFKNKLFVKAVDDVSIQIKKVSFLKGRDWAKKSVSLFLFI